MNTTTTDHKSVRLVNLSKQIENNINIASNYAKFNVLSEFLKTCCEVFCSEKNKQQVISQEDIDFFREKFKQLEDLGNKIASN